MADKLSFRVNGKDYAGYKNLTITRSVEAISSYFSFEFADVFNPSEPWPLTPQDQVEILIDDEAVMNGFIDVLSANLSAQDRRFTVEGRDRTSDLVDCILPDTLETYDGLSIGELCERMTRNFRYEGQKDTLIKFIAGRGAYNRAPLRFTMEKGSTVFENLDRAASKAGALLVPDGKGNLRITVQGDRPCVVDLVEGQNLLSLEFRRDYTKRFSDYTVEGRERSPKTAKKAEGWFGKGEAGGKTSVPKSSMRDPNIRRYRPYLIRPNADVSKLNTDAIAGFEVATRIAASLEITAVVAGWTQLQGIPWKINETVKILAPRLGLGNEISGEYLIAETQYSLSETEGKTTTMKLLPQDAYLNPITVPKFRKDQKGQGKGWFGDEYQGGVKVILPKDAPIKRPTPLKGGRN